MKGVGGPVAVAHAQSTGPHCAHSAFGLLEVEVAAGDVKGAFLEAGPLEERHRPLYARIPAGGIPGVPESSVIEVLGNVYGQNDAPTSWFQTFNAAALKLGWERSSFDPCLYFLRDSSRVLRGLIGVHVDDTGETDLCLRAQSRP